LASNSGWPFPNILTFLEFRGGPFFSGSLFLEIRLIISEYTSFSAREVVAATDLFSAYPATDILAHSTTPATERSIVSCFTEPEISIVAGLPDVTLAFGPEIRVNRDLTSSMTELIGAGDALTSGQAGDALPTNGED